jgi:hypothetical protein
MVLLAPTASPAGGDGGDTKGNEEEEDDNAADHVRGSISGKIDMIIGGWIVAMVIEGAVVVPM